MGGRSSVPLSKRGRARHSRKFRSSRGWNDDKFTRVRRERGKKKKRKKGRGNPLIRRAVRTRALNYSSPMGGGFNKKRGGKKK